MQHEVWFIFFLHQRSTTCEKSAGSHSRIPSKLTIAELCKNMNHILPQPIYLTFLAMNAILHPDLPSCSSKVVHPPLRKQKNHVHLAQTVWPRFGGDRANRSLLAIAGPHATPTWQKISLSACQAVRSADIATSGVIVMPDETLRVCHTGMLSAVTLDGTILWQLDLTSLIAEDRRCFYSLPTALHTGETLLVLPDSLLIVDRLGGHLQERGQACP